MLKKEKKHWALNSIYKAGQGNLKDSDEDEKLLSGVQ